SAHRGNCVLEEQVAVHGAHRCQLRRLIVDEDQGRILRCEEMVRKLIADRCAGHGASLWSFSVSWRTSSRSRPSASISVRTPCSPDRSSTPVSTVIEPSCSGTIAGKADRNMAPRCPLTRMAYSAGPITPCSVEGG